MKIAFGTPSAKPRVKAFKQNRLSYYSEQMKARFEIRSIKSQWKPPFNKEITDEVYEVGEGETFDRIVGNGNDESVYKVLSLGGNIAKVQYSKLFTLKTHNPGNYELKLALDAPIEMTYLWGEDGITKKITFKGFVTKSEQFANTKDEAEELENSDTQATEVCEQTSNSPEKCE